MNIFEYELFLFKEDHFERENKLGENRDMAKFLQTLINDFIYAPGKADSQLIQRNIINLDPATIKRLKALGYLKWK